MKYIGIIPSRYASSRFPGKPLIDLKGKSMIQRVFEGASKSNLLNEVIVATDDQRIFEEVKNFGGNVQMTSSEHRSGTDRCAELAKNFDDNDIIVNIQGDEPLINPKQLDVLLEAFDDPNVEIATLTKEDNDIEALQNPNRIKVVENSKGNALYFSRSFIPNTHHSPKEVLKSFTFKRHIGVYAYRVKTLLKISELSPCDLERIESLEQLRWMFYGYQIKLVKTDIETPNIDVPEDVQTVLNYL